MTTVYVSIGNSDDKLTQVEWAAYAGTVQGAVRRAAGAVYGEWTSLPLAAFQNACWCVEVEPARADALRRELSGIAGMYRQDSIAWAEVPLTEFIGAS
jgi:hypothetical protein